MFFVKLTPELKSYHVFTTLLFYKLPIVAVYFQIFPAIHRKGAGVLLHPTPDPFLFTSDATTLLTHLSYQNLLKTLLSVRKRPVTPEWRQILPPVEEMWHASTSTEG